MLLLLLLFIPLFFLFLRLLLLTFQLNLVPASTTTTTCSPRSDWAIPLPQGMEAKDAAKIGTAGYTAMLCVQVREE